MIARMLLLLATLAVLALVLYALNVGSPLWPERARTPVGLGPPAGHLSPKPPSSWTLGQTPFVQAELFAQVPHA